MITRRETINGLVGVTALAAGIRTGAAQSVPTGYPADYGDLIARAKKEGRVAVYTSTDEAQGLPLSEAFKKEFGIQVDYNSIGTTDVYNRVISEAAAGQVGADVAWTSSMDLQIVLANKGLLDTYKSAEAAHLPQHSVYKDMVYGTSIEPVAMLYNKTLLKPEWVPHTRADLVQLLKDHAADLKGKIASFDPEKSGIGFLLAQTDLHNTTTFWDLARGFGKAEGKVYGSSGAMREKVVSGEQLLAFNVIGSYALQWMKSAPGLGVVFASDYTAAFQRVAAVTKGAPHPAAGRLYLDYMLSQKGQEVLAGLGVPPLRLNYTGPLDKAQLDKLVGSNMKVIPVDDKLADNMNPKVRAEFFQQWKKAMRGEG